MARFRAWLPAALMFCLVGSPASSLWNAPASVCDLQASERGEEITLRARFVREPQGVSLTDPACPASRLPVADESSLAEFFRQFDPDGRRFGKPPGAGTYAEIELYGRKQRDQFVVSGVGAYDRFDILDRRWRIASTETLSGSGWHADEQFPFTRDSRKVRDFGNITIINGTIGNEAVASLLKLVRADASTICQVSESAQGLVRVQCSWQKGHTMDMRNFVFAPEAQSWRMILKSDGVRR